MGTEFDTAVVGAGAVGSSIAWGLSQLGERVLVLDGGDRALRAARGNFALIWTQSKGMGRPEYSKWSVRSADLWGKFAGTLLDQTGIDVAFERPGGFYPTLDEQEWEQRHAFLKRLNAQLGMEAIPYDMLSHDEAVRLVPALGPTVAGASYCPLDGHCNALRLLHALHAGMQKQGVRYVGGVNVDAVCAKEGGFEITTVSHTQFRAGKVILAAGLENEWLAKQLGMRVPVRPQRGHLMVTEKVEPFLNYPLSKVRQTDEGGVMIGDSMEECGRDSSVSLPVLSVLAERAIRMFPVLANINVVRTWTCLRVMTPDGFPVYAQSESHPGAYAVSCHSGITLAAAHALLVPGFIVSGGFPSFLLEPFGTGRFHVQEAA